MEKSEDLKHNARFQESTVPSTELLNSLQQRADTLLSEFRSYQDYLRLRDLSKAVETRIFRRGVEAEHKNLCSTVPRNDVKESDPKNEDVTAKAESKRLQALRSSNLPFYEAIWTSAKQFTGIRALGRKLYWDEVQKPTDQRSVLGDQVIPASIPKQRNSRSAIVDIVANDGAEWIKVSIVSAKRLIFEIAKEGWEGYGGDSDEEHSDNEKVPPGTRSPEKAKLEIVGLAEDLREASHATRIKYRHPQVKFILPRIHEGENDTIDAVLADIRATGALTICGQTTQAQQIYDLNNMHATPPSLFNHMLPSPSHPPLTPTLNIDCTILLALISDISHVVRADLPASPSNPSGVYHSAIKKQIDAEEHTPLLPQEIYTLLKGRKMVATAPAAKRMREIVTTMGTTAEKDRASILFAEDPFPPTHNLRKQWAERSCWPVSNDLNLPITTVADVEATETNDLITRLTPTINLSPINASVFLYGWRNDIVTVTSNKVVAGGIEKAINRLLDEDEQSGRAGVEIRDSGDTVGPKIYICETARSLIGKEKQNGLRP